MIPATTRSGTIGAALTLALLGCNLPSRAPLHLSDYEGGEITGDEVADEGGDEAADSGMSSNPSGMSFVPEYDIDDDFGCDPFAQDCPGAEKCVPYASTGGNWDRFKCVPVLGEQAVDEPCSYDGTFEATDDCDASSHCWNVMDVEGEAIGTCLAFCQGTADDPICPAQTSCMFNGNGIPSLCTPTCDPFVQDCGPGLACYWTHADFSCVFTTADIPAGEPCGFINDCAGGLICLTAEFVPECAGSACCSPFCDLGGVACEAVPGTSCLPLFEEGTAPPGYEHVGVCILPDAPEDP